MDSHEKGKNRQNPQDLKFVPFDLLNWSSKMVPILNGAILRKEN